MTVIRRKPWLYLVLLLVVSTSLFAGGTREQSSANAKSAKELTILETGSTLLFPLFNLWIPDYVADHPTIKITSAGTGSGTGIAKASDGSAQIGASDAYMGDAAVAAHPGILNIPLAISAQAICYNLPGLNSVHLRLSGVVLAGIYSGRIASWNDPAIARLNPGVTLPRHEIVPVRRSDGSGDTFLFTHYLAATSRPWRSTVGAGVSVKWPEVANAVGAKGNTGMIDGLRQHPYSIAYVGVSYQDQLAKLGLGLAALENRAGKFVLPTAETIAQAAQVGFRSTPPDERVSLIYEPGAISYPIVNYEYAIVQSKQASTVMAQGIKRFLTWALDPNGGESASYLDQIHFQVLPPPIVRMSQVQIDKIGS